MKAQVCFSVRESLLEEGRSQGWSISGEVHCRQSKRSVQSPGGTKAHDMAREL